MYPPAPATPLDIEPAKRTPIPISDTDFANSWAMVELHRWQYGELPLPSDCRPVDMKVAARAMASALRTAMQSTAEFAQTNCPSPFNCATVLAYLSRQESNKPSAMEQAMDVATRILQAEKHPERIPNPGDVATALEEVAEALYTVKILSQARRFAAPKALYGRNTPCPCGSGKKYKKCCLKP